MAAPLDSYTRSMDALRFSDEAKSRIADLLREAVTLSPQHRFVEQWHNDGPVMLGRDLQIDQLCTPVISKVGPGS